MRKAPARAMGFEKAGSRRKQLPRALQEVAPAAGGEKPLKTRIMYIENKSEKLNNVGRIGRVSFSKTGKTLYYAGKSFQSLKGGYKANYFDLATKEEYWISGPRVDGQDRLYGTPGVEIDEDVREEYWLTIRKLPARVRSTTT